MNGPEATALGEWVKIAFYVIGSLAGIAVSLNQFRRKPHIDVDLSSLTARIDSVEVTLLKKQDQALCGPSHAAFQATMDSFASENKRRDHLTRDQFQAVAVALGELKKEMREDIKGLHERSENVLKAVSRLEGKVEK